MPQAHIAQALTHYLRVGNTHMAIMCFNQLFPTKCWQWSPLFLK